MTNSFDDNLPPICCILLVLGFFFPTAVFGTIFGLLMLGGFLAHIASNPALIIVYAIGAYLFSTLL